MIFEQKLEKINHCLDGLNANARHAIELKETFTFPAYDTKFRKTIKDTNNVRCYKICLEAIYFEFTMTLMRMFDSTRYKTECFEKIFEYLSDDFVNKLENKIRKKIKPTIEGAREDYKSLKGLHYMKRLRDTRHKAFAHTTSNLDINEIADYGHAENLLNETLPMLNQLNWGIKNKEELYDVHQKAWKGFSTEFWSNFQF